MLLSAILGATKAYLDQYIHIDYSGIKILIAPDYPQIHINSIRVNNISQLPQKLTVVLKGVKLTLNNTMSLISDIQIEAKSNQHNVLLLVLINGQTWGDIKLSMDLINMSSKLVSLNLIYDNQKLLKYKFKHKLIQQLHLSLTKVKLDTNILNYLRQLILNSKGLVIDLQPSMPIKIQDLFYTSPKVLGLKITTN